MYEKYYERLREECLIRNRSSQTAQAYIAHISAFMNWTGCKPMEELCLQDARDFNLYKRKSGITASTCNLYNSSLAFLLYRKFPDFLGHADIKTTGVYAKSSLKMKKAALEKINNSKQNPLPVQNSDKNWTADKDLMEWLKGLG